MTRRRFRPASLLPLVVVWAWSSDANAATQALVIGADYRNSGNSSLVLENTLIDAAAVAGAFRDIGLESIAVVENPNSNEWFTAVDRFVANLEPEDVAVVYFAGHAVQVGGQNYLLAGNEIAAIPMERILSPIMARARGSLIVIDACRNNPFSDPLADNQVLMIRDASASVDRGLTELDIAEARASTGLSQMGNLRGRDAIVLFSTEPGNIAMDGAPGRGSPFANAFVGEISRRQSLDRAIRRIVDEVEDVTDGQQIPWRQGDLSFPLFLAGQPRFPVP